MTTRNIEEKEVFIPFASNPESTVTSDNISVSTPGLYNCLIETTKNISDKVTTHVRSRPPLHVAQGAPFASSTTRGLYYDMASASIWKVVGTAVYRNGVNVLTLASSTGAVFFDIYRYGVLDVIILCEAGSNYKLSTVNKTTGALIGSVSTGKECYTPPVVLDGYVFFLEANTQRIYNSNVGIPTTFTVANDFIDAEMFGDTLLYITKYRNHLVAWGSNSTEYFYDAAAEIGSPLRRRDSYASIVGIINNIPFTSLPFTQTAKGPAWVGATVSNSYGIFMLDEYSPQKISTPVIDAILAEAVRLNATGSIDVALSTIGYKGTDLLLCSFNNASIIYTYVYDVQEGIWYQWTFFDNSVRLYVRGSVSSKDTNFLLLDDGSNEDIYFMFKTFVAGNTDFDLEGTVTRSVQTDVQYFDTNNKKLFKWVDLVGKTSTNQSIQLKYGPTTVQADLITHDTKPNLAVVGYTQEQFRWYNLGRHTQISMQFIITGDDDFVLDGVNVSYIEGKS